MNKAIFLDRDGVVTVKKSFIKTPAELEIYSFVAQAISRINKSGYLAVLITNQSAAARNLCTVDDIYMIHNRLQYLLQQQNAVLDGIYFCPHLYNPDDKSLNPAYNIDCNCRKPKAGMIMQAAKELNIDLSKSYMIGDSERDIIAGKSAGCKTIGVKTGHALKGAESQPDYVFENLFDAVCNLV